MAKIIDITEKLDFEDNPKIKVKNEELEVNADATTALKLMGLMGDGGEDAGMTVSRIGEICELLFTKDSFKAIKSMNLQFKDFATLVKAAMSLITGDGDSGE